MSEVTGFQASWWSKNRHIQTLWSTFFKSKPSSTDVKRLRIELNDGDFIDVDFFENKHRPTLLLLHGLEGSINSPYIGGLVNAAKKKNWQIAVMHFRSCSGEPNRLLRSYNSGVSEDLNEVITKLADKGISIDYLVGFSLGGNVTLKWLGELADKAPVKAAVAVSVPMLLGVSATEINSGFSRLYEYILLRTLRAKTREKLKQFGDDILPNKTMIRSLNCFWRFDNYVTAPTHGYESAEDYYNKASSKQFIKTIGKPTLIIQAKDDPFMNETVLPTKDELSKWVTLEVNENGGHVGFVHGKWPWKAEYYLDKRIPEFLEQY
ncbi:MAG: putative alpha/beta-fold hydrolase [Polaribacter sp.]|jgi:predicted alpha/beta-fold hydrolase